MVEYNDSCVQIINAAVQLNNILNSMIQAILNFSKHLNNNIKPAPKASRLINRATSPVNPPIMD